MNLVKDRKLFLLSASVLFVLFFQSISHAHHTDDDVGTSLLLNSSYQTNHLGRVSRTTADPLDHNGWDYDGVEWSYQDTNDLWKINAARGDKITVDIIVTNAYSQEFENFDPPVPFNMELFDSQYQETPITTINIDKEDYIQDSKINWLDTGLESGRDLSTNETYAQWRLVFTADKTGLFYLNVKGDDLSSQDFIDTYPNGKPYKIRATVTKPKLLTAYQTSGTLSSYPPEQGFYSPTDYYSLNNLKVGDEITLTLRSTSDSSGLQAKMTVYNTSWGTPVSGSPIPVTDIVEDDSQGQLKFKPTSTSVIIKVERLDDTQGPYSLITTVLKPSSMTIIGPSVINYPQKAKLSGSIVLASGKKVDVPVHIYKKAVGGTWARVATVKTNSLGKYEYLAAVPKNTYFYAKWAGDPVGSSALRYLSAKSTNKYVKVTPSLSITASATSLKQGYTTAIKGRMLPAAGHTGKLINIQVQKSTGAWSKVGTAKLSSTGYYSFIWRPAAKGSFRLRAHFAGDIDHLQKASLTKIINVY